MQLSPDHGNIDLAIEELERELPLVFLADRRRRHKSRSALQRQFEILMAAGLRRD
jgi:hypothetical protein